MPISAGTFPGTYYRTGYAGWASLITLYMSKTYGGGLKLELVHILEICPIYMTWQRLWLIRRQFGGGR